MHGLGSIEKVITEAQVQDLKLVQEIHARQEGTVCGVWLRGIRMALRIDRFSHHADSVLKSAARAQSNVDEAVSVCIRQIRSITQYFERAAHCCR
jgi:hypothetical protein